MKETIIKTQNCKSCGIEFSITDKDQEFYNKISPTFNSQKFPIPNPTLCPSCRIQRRYAFRNETQLYRRTSDASGQSIITMYSQDKPFTVYNQEEWRSDKWDPMDYGMEFDFSKTFFEQFDALQKKVPQMGLINSDNENCDYNNYILGCKDCYLSSVVYYGAENIYYSNWIYDSQNIVNSYSVKSSKECYQCQFIENCYNCHYLNHSTDCADCYFSRNLKACKNCFLCCNLINQEYCFMNKKFTKDKYMELISKYDFSNPHDIYKLINEYNKFSLDKPFPHAEIVNCETCTGDNLRNSSNSYDCFDCFDIEDSKHFCGEKAKSVYDGIGGTIELAYEFSRCGFGQKSFFSIDGIECSDIYYCMAVYSSKNLFGCTGLRNKEYCILNKQYTKDEYESLVAKIIQHMQSTGERGEFFPIRISPFAYNETLANDFFPLTKEEILSKGHIRKEPEDKNFKGNEYIPLSIDQYDEKIVGADKANKNINNALTGIMKCSITNRPFKLIKTELDFYIKHQIPIPTSHPDQRYKEKLAKRNPQMLFDRNCEKCGINIKTSYSPDRPEIVYCEQCYEKEIY